jgi:hypothetical protein
MTDKNKTVENRRKLLKSVAAGGGAIIAGKTLPKEWSRPVVDSVILPAHAATSLGPFSGSAGSVMLDSDSMLAQAMDAVIPQAHAQYEYVRNLSWCIVANADRTAADCWFLLTESMDGFVCMAYLWEKANVPANTTTNLGMSTDGCSNNNVGSAGEWLNDLGLVKDAQASGVMGASVTLYSLLPGYHFIFTPANGTPVDKTLVIKDCGAKTINCQPDKCYL